MIGPLQLAHEATDPIRAIGLGTVILALSYATWILVENPLAKVTLPPRWVVMTSIMVTLFSIVALLTLFPGPKGDHNPFLLPPIIQGLDNQALDPVYVERLPDDPNIPLGPILFVGDSYTDEWMLSYKAIQEQKKVNYSRFSSHACLWMQLSSHLPWQGPSPIDCSKLQQTVISQDPMPPRTIFLFGVSPMWARVRPFNSTQDFIEIGAPGWAEVIHE